MLGFLRKKVKKQNEKDDKKNDNQPWVQVIGEHISEEHGIKIELDWNDAFIKYLKKNGYTGVSEEAIVQKWLTHLYQHLIENINKNQKSTFE